MVGYKQLSLAFSIKRISFKEMILNVQRENDIIELPIF